MSHKQSSPSRCDYDPLHRRPVVQKKIVQTSSSNQKKLVGRINNLESQLGQAQDELKILKDQLNSTDTVKRAKSRRSSINPYKGVRESRKRDEKTLSETNKATDVFEVPVESRNDDINVLKAKLEAKEKELEISVEENERLKIEVEERITLIASAEAKEEEMRTRMSQLVEEVEGNKEKRRELILKMEVMEAAKEGMEEEMKKLRIQTEQWRKAADAAAVVMSEGMDRRVSGRWGSNSMDKQYGNIFENPVGVGGYAIADELENELVGHAKRRGSGIRMIGELWKKKVQK